MVILVPFIVIWITHGLAWAMGVLLGVAIIYLSIFGSRGKRRFEGYYDRSYEEDGDYEGGVVGMFISTIGQSDVAIVEELGVYQVFISPVQL